MMASTKGMVSYRGAMPALRNARRSVVVASRMASHSRLTADHARVPFGCDGTRLARSSTSEGGGCLRRPRCGAVVEAASRSSRRSRARPFDDQSGQTGSRPYSRCRRGGFAVPACADRCEGWGARVSTHTVGNSLRSAMFRLMFYGPYQAPHASGEGTVVAVCRAPQAALREGQRGCANCCVAMRLPAIVGRGQASLVSWLRNASNPRRNLGLLSAQYALESDGEASQLSDAAIGDDIDMLWHRPRPGKGPAPTSCAGRFRLSL